MKKRLKPFDPRLTESIRRSYPPESPSQEKRESRQHWLDNQILLYELALHGIQDAIVVTDHDAKITFINRAARQLFARPFVRLKGRNVLGYLIDLEGRPVNGRVGRAVRKGKIIRDRKVFVRRPDGALVSVLLTVTPLIQDGVLVRTIGVFRDLTELERKNAELEGVNRELAKANQENKELALTDELTGLGNMRSFLLHLRQHIEFARRRDKPIGLIYLDLNKFKPVNDAFGHDEGDRVIREVASRLRKTLFDSDITVRLYGDEFAALLPEVDAHRLEKAVEKLSQALRFSITLHRPRTAVGETVEISAAIGGVTRTGSTIPDAEALIRFADEAMYRCKQESRLYFLDNDEPTAG